MTQGREGRVDGRDERDHVVVAGGGNAGLCAALSARDRGAEVVLVERSPSGGVEATAATPATSATPTTTRTNGRRCRIRRTSS